MKIILKSQQATTKTQITTKHANTLNLSLTATQKEDQNWFSRQSIAECRSKVLQNAPREHSAILSTFIKLFFVLTPLFGLFLVVAEDRFDCSHTRFMSSLIIFLFTVTD